jgi:thiol-disulfide isomerase/thioredoxin
MKYLIVTIIALLAVLQLSQVGRSGGTDDKAPEIKTTGKWINTDKELSLADLKGKVVLLQFWTFGCYNCTNTTPYINGWYEKYGAEGLEIIGIHCPEFDNEYKLENVIEHVKELGIKYPVLTDNNFSNWREYDVHAWPTMFIVDKEGNIRYKKVGEGSYKKTEAVIAELLSE